MRGRPGCPTGQEKKSVGATVSNPLFYKERLGTKSPPHPPQCAHWGTYGLWWLRLDLTEQSPGLFDPQGEGFGEWRHSGLEAFFRKNAFQHIFSGKMRPKSVLAYRTK